MSYLIIPRKLDERIKSINLSKIQLNHTYQFISYLSYLNLKNRKVISLNSFKDIHSKVLREHFTKDYTKFLDPLIKNGIIQRSFYYNKSGKNHFKGVKPIDNKPFGYKINENLFDVNDLIYVQFKRKPFKHKNKQIKSVINDLNQLESDIQGLLNEARNYCIDDFIKVNNEIKEEEVFIIDLDVRDKDGEPAQYTLKTNIAINRAQHRHVDLIKYKNNCYFAHYKQFKEVREYVTHISMIHAITMLYNGEFYASINDTNNRLDTNLTNLKGSFLKGGYIKLHGENLADIDLKNSQPTLLAYLLSDIEHVVEQFPNITGNLQFPSIDITAPDVKEFIQRAGSGLIYDYISEKGGWTRELAKNIFIKVMFSKPRWNSTYKKKLKELFPTFISWMDEFKKINHSHESLAIILQKIESEIFIQNIYPTIRKEYIVYTKHDSIVCRVSQKPEIKKKMEAILDQYGFRYRLE